jgi:hypothetical protein
MDIQDVLRILKNGAEKPKDDLNDYTKGKRDGQVQAYSHAWTLVKNLSISGVMQTLTDYEKFTSGDNYIGNKELIDRQIKEFIEVYCA